MTCPHCKSATTTAYDAYYNECLTCGTVFTNDGDLVA